MGSVKTQSRIVKKVNPLMRIDPQHSDWFLYGNFPALDSIQRTTSYRSHRPAPGSSLVSDSDFRAELEEFSDVTRNGFTEPSPLYDTGHNFFTTKTSFSTSHPNWDARWVQLGRDYRMRGPLVIAAKDNPRTISYPQDVSYISAIANEKGAAAIKATAPTKSPASLATFLGELIHGLPMLASLDHLANYKRPDFRLPGKEYLSYEFGVASAKRDLEKILTSVSESSRILQQYHRDSGRQIRRRLNFGPTEDVTFRDEYTDTSWSGNMPGVFGWGSTGNPAFSVSTPINHKTTTTQRVWFSGAYSYYLQTDDDLIARFARYEQNANRILGSRITAETIWDLGPWSWLLDWKLNIGDVLANAELLGSDGLVLRYGYLMCHTKVKTVSSIPNVRFYGGSTPVHSGPVTNTATRETKERVKATPYGFGVTASGFSAKQWAILGALGLTLAPHRLRDFPAN